MRVPFINNRHDKQFIVRSCNKRAETMLQLSRFQLKTITAVLAGQAPVKEHQYRGLLLMGGSPGDVSEEPVT